MNYRIRIDGRRWNKGEENLAENLMRQRENDDEGKIREKRATKRRERPEKTGGLRRIRREIPRRVLRNQEGRRQPKVADAMTEDLACKIQ